MTAVRFGFALAAAFAASIGIASAQQTVVKVGYAPFGTPVQFLPGATTDNYKTLDPKGTMAQGAMIEVMNAVAKDAGIQIQFVATPVSDRVANLNAHTVDMVLTGTNGAVSAATPLLDFGTAIYNDGDALLVRKDDPKQYVSWDDLKGTTIGLLKGSASDGPAQMSGTFKEVKVYGTAADLDQALSTGQVQAVLESSLVSASYRFNPATGSPADAAYGLKVVTSYKSRFPAANGMTVAKGSEQLLAKLNASVAKLKADGTIKAAFTKYGIGNVLVN